MACKELLDRLLGAALRRAHERRLAVRWRHGAWRERAPAAAGGSAIAAS